ncbi:hypothetical protein V2J09_000513 [Rumex salicifolius]
MEEALELVRCKDTKERMAGVDHLHQLLEASSKPLSSSEVTSLVDACLDLLNDDYFRVSQGALQVLASAAVHAGDHLRIHVNSLVPAAVERLGDAKQPVRDAARGLLLTLMEVSSPTTIMERAGSYAWEHKSWRVREEFVRTVTSAINLFTSTELPLQRDIMPPIVHMLNDPNHVVTEAATACNEARDINGRLERIEPKVRSFDGGSNLGSVSEHKLANLKPKRSSHKPKSSSPETSLFGGLQMNGYQLNGGAYSYEKSVTGCLGRAANLFDIKTGVTRSKLLTEKPHHDGSNLATSLSDVSRISSPIAKEFGDKLVVSEMNRPSFSRKSEGTPVKMLIAQEMTKDLECGHDSPNVVAKLMGLDAPPHQDLPDLGYGKRNPEFYSWDRCSEIPEGYWHQKDGFFDRNSGCEDTYEMWQPSPKTNCLRNLSLQNGSCSENTNEQKMALIRQKFMDAKRLSTDEKLRQTKEFQDALDVLSSNQHLFLKVLQEPTSLISHHLCERQPIPLPMETKRITVLKPSKMVFNDKFPASGNRNEKHVKKFGPHNRFGLSPVVSTRRFDESSTQPTRIVVLKPTPGMMQDVREVPSVPSSTANLHGPSFFEVPRDVESREAREVAKEIMQQMRENLAGHQTDETVLSSVLSYGYTGDESSFNKSEAEFVGNFSDSEAMSPAFKHSWDYINRNGGPYSSSSLSCASYTPESSVAREAKKRLSERWAVMASNGTCVEQRHKLRSSSTLGEMLALSEIQNPEICEIDNTKSDEVHRVSTSSLISNTGVVLGSPGTLLRSKSLPVEALDQENRMDGPNKQAAKSSFRGKVTSLLFQRSKKLCKGRIYKYQSEDQAVSCHAEASTPYRMPCDDNSDFQSPDLRSANRTLWLELNEEPRQGLAPQQVTWSTLKSATSGMSGENQDQPSPISVLEPAFEEDDSNTMCSSDATTLDPFGMQPTFSLGRSNLIDKSPPIGSIARTLSWDESSAQPATSNPPNSPFRSHAGGFHEEGEWLFLVHSLLSAADVENESQLRSNITKWHSPDSPLDPLMREKYVNLISKDAFYEANRRQLRSNCWLVFDCVNAALVDVTGMGSYAIQSAHEKRLVTTMPGDLLADRVLARVKHWFFSSDWVVEGGGDDNNHNNVTVERVVQKDLVGRGWEWEDLSSIEMGIIGKEIETKLMEELVEESVGECTGKN